MAPAAKCLPNLRNAPSRLKKNRICASFYHRHFRRSPTRRLYTHVFVCTATRTMDTFGLQPVRGEIIADAVEGKSNPLLQKFRRRPEIHAGEQKEAARFEREP